MNVVYGDSINIASYNLLERFKDMIPEDNFRTRRRVLDLGPTMVCISDSRQRVLTLPGRNFAPAAAFAEIIWVLSGRNDIEWLKRYLPRAPEFSDDGETWRAGYGPRLRNLKGIDQISHVVDVLRNDPTSRQATIVIIDPEEDYPAIGKTRDYPCTNILYFKIRDGRLDCECLMRSNDVLWGFQHVNGLAWTIVQNIVASTLKIPVGKYYHYSSSLHCYEDMLPKVEKIMKCREFDVYRYLKSNPMEYYCPLPLLDAELPTFFLAEEELAKDPMSTKYIFHNQLLVDAISLCASFWVVKSVSDGRDHNESFEQAVRILKDASPEVFLVGVEYAHRLTVRKFGQTRDQYDAMLEWLFPMIADRADLASTSNFVLGLDI